MISFPAFSKLKSAFSSLSHQFLLKCSPNLALRFAVKCRDIEMIRNSIKAGASLYASPNLIPFIFGTSITLPFAGLLGAFYLDLPLPIGIVVVPLICLACYIGSVDPRFTSPMNKIIKSKDFDMIKLLFEKDLVNEHTLWKAHKILLEKDTEFTEIQHEAMKILCESYPLKVLNAELSRDNGFDKEDMAEVWGMRGLLRINDGGLLNGEYAFNELEIKRANEYFEKIICPQYKNEFEKYGSSLEERLTTIERQIKTLILQYIKENASDNDVIEFINKEEANLIAGKEAALRASLPYFKHQANNKNIAYSAWRSYNPYVRVSGDWENLLALPITTKEHAIYTTPAATMSIAGGKVTNLTASKIVRERIAYYYLAIMNEANEENRKNGIANFISQLDSIINANGINDPSCFPGCLVRTANMGRLVAPLSSSTATLIRARVKDFFQPYLLETFKTFLKQCENEEERKCLYEAMTGLSKHNAREIILGNTHSLNEKHLQLYIKFRKTLISNIGPAIEKYNHEHPNVKIDVTAMSFQLITKFFTILEKNDINNSQVKKLVSELKALTNDIAELYLIDFFYKLFNWNMNEVEMHLNVLMELFRDSVIKNLTLDAQAVIPVLIAIVTNIDSADSAKATIAKKAEIRKLMKAFEKNPFNDLKPYHSQIVELAKFLFCGSEWEEENQIAKESNMQLLILSAYLSDLSHEGFLRVLATEYQKFGDENIILTQELISNAIKKNLAANNRCPLPENEQELFNLLFSLIPHSNLCTQRELDDKVQYVLEKTNKITSEKTLSKSFLIDLLKSLLPEEDITTSLESLEVKLSNLGYSIKASNPFKNEMANLSKLVEKNPALKPRLDNLKIKMNLFETLAKMFQNVEEADERFLLRLVDASNDTSKEEVKETLKKQDREILKKQGIQLEFTGTGVNFIPHILTQYSISSTSSSSLSFSQKEIDSHSKRNKIQI